MMDRLSGTSAADGDPPGWADGLAIAVTVVDVHGTVVYMNRCACSTFEKYGGSSLIGHDIYECHPETAKQTIRGLFETRRANAYTIEKGGVRKLIYQCPWFRDDEFAGFVELSLPIPEALPHRRRG